jgi:small subunit ribosomal protein S6
MTLPAPTYDLVLLLDTQAEDAVRAKIVADAREAISAQGELLRHDEWGERPLAYPIDHRKSAEYHLLQFHAASPELIAGLSRTLHITDGIVRFRINKLGPGTPEAPDMRAEPLHAPHADRDAERAQDGEPAVA